MPLAIITAQIVNPALTEFTGIKGFIDNKSKFISFRIKYNRWIIELLVSKIFFEEVLRWMMEGVVLDHNSESSELKPIQKIIELLYNL